MLFQAGFLLLHCPLRLHRKQESSNFLASFVLLILQSSPVENFPQSRKPLLTQRPNEHKGHWPNYTFPIWWLIIFTASSTYSSFAEISFGLNYLNYLLTPDRWCWGEGWAWGVKEGLLHLPCFSFSLHPQRAEIHMMIQQQLRQLLPERKVDTPAALALLCGSVAALAVWKWLGRKMIQKKMEEARRTRDEGMKKMAKAVQQFREQVTCPQVSESHWGVCWCCPSAPPSSPIAFIRRRCASSPPGRGKAALGEREVTALLSLDEMWWESTALGNVNYSLLGECKLLTVKKFLNTGDEALDLY